jgi:hypothetical protein
VPFSFFPELTRVMLCQNQRIPVRNNALVFISSRHRC